MKKEKQSIASSCSGAQLEIIWNEFAKAKQNFRNWKNYITGQKKIKASFHIFCTALRFSNPAEWQIGGLEGLGFFPAAFGSSLYLPETVLLQILYLHSQLPGHE